MSEIYDWKPTGAGNNILTPPNGAPEGGTTPQQLNDVIREIQAVVRRFYNDSEWRDVLDGAAASRSDVDTMVVTGVDVTSHFTPGTRVKITGVVTQYGIATGSSFATNTLIDILMDDANADNSPDDIDSGANMLYKHNSPSIMKGGWRDVGAGKDENLVSHGEIGTAAALNFGTGDDNVPKASQVPGLVGPAYETTQLSGDWAIPNPTGTERDIPGLTALDFPGDGPDGTRKYKISAMINVLTGGVNGIVQLGLYIGTNGNMADTREAIGQIWCNAKGSGNRATNGNLYGVSPHIVTYVVQPPNLAKVGLTVRCDFNPSATVLGGAGSRSYIHIEEVIE